MMKRLIVPGMIIDQKVRTNNLGDDIYIWDVSIPGHIHSHRLTFTVHRDIKFDDGSARAAGAYLKQEVASLVWDFLVSQSGHD